MPRESISPEVVEAELLELAATIAELKDDLATECTKRDRLIVILVRDHNTHIRHAARVADVTPAMVRKILKKASDTDAS